eukprot:403334441
MEPQKLKSKNQYSSTILKFRLKKKVQQNGAVTSITNRKIQSLDYQAEEYRKAKSMDIIGQILPPQSKQVKVKGHDINADEADDQNIGDLKEMESLFAGSSQSSVSGIFEEDLENHYQTSIMACTVIKEPEQLIDKDLLNLLGYIKSLPVPDVSDLTDKCVEFGDYTRHKTLIWDMDETLIHSQLLMPNQEKAYNSDFTITLKNGTRFGVAIDPADQEYADLIIDKLDPNKTLFPHRMYRQHCVKVEDAYVKDLRIITDRDLEDMLIVDNSIISFAFQINNGIPICAFYSLNKFQDQEMLYLIVFLEEVYYQHKDVREANKTTFKLQELMTTID